LIVSEKPFVEEQIIEAGSPGTVKSEDKASRSRSRNKKRR